MGGITADDWYARKDAEAARRGAARAASAVPVGLDGGDPTPEERADFIIKRLEQFIRNGRTVAEGVNFREWQQMAHAEIAEAITAAGDVPHHHARVTRRLLLVMASSLVTIGFWGAAFSYDKAEYLPAAVICVASGVVLMAVAGEWRLRRGVRRSRARRRGRSMARIEDLTRKIKRMERELEKESKGLEKRLKESLGGGRPR